MALYAIYANITYYKEYVLATGRTVTDTARSQDKRNIFLYYLFKDHQMVNIIYYI